MTFRDLSIKIHENNVKIKTLRLKETKSINEKIDVLKEINKKLKYQNYLLEKRKNFLSKRISSSLKEKIS